MEDFNQIIPQARLAGIPEEARQWLMDFYSKLNPSGATKIFNRLVQLGVEAEGQCDCDQNSHSILHHCHTIFNRMVWDLLHSKRGLIAKLRRAARTDLRATDDVINGKAYGQDLLDNFLRRKPNPKWVGTETATGI